MIYGPLTAQEGDAAPGDFTDHNTHMAKACPQLRVKGLPQAQAVVATKAPKKTTKATKPKKSSTEELRGAKGSSTQETTLCK